MDTGLYVALSSQIALEQRLRTIANNVANINTTGFQAAHVRFEELLDGVGSKSTAFVSRGATVATGDKAALEQTGAALDFAVSGNRWFAVQTEAGTVVTRDGRFRMTEEGALVSVEGHAVLDPGGAPIVLNPNGGRVEAGADGSLRQGGVQIAALGVFDYEPSPDFRRFGSSGILTETPPVPVVDTTDRLVLQGFLEKSNVNAVEEMTRLIAVHRAFENTAALMRDSEETLETAIRVLGGSGGQ